MTLGSELTDVFRIPPDTRRALTRLGIRTIRDLLFYFPQSYSSFSAGASIANAPIGERVSIIATIEHIETKKSFRTKVPMAKAKVTDPTGSLSIAWFNQAFIGKVLRTGMHVRLQGKITDGASGRSMSNPDYEVLPDSPINIGRTLFAKNPGDLGDVSYPIYRETKGITSRWMYHTIEKIFKSGVLSEIVDYIPSDVLKKYSLPTLKTALIWMHTPHKDSDAVAARKRFAFEEILFIQIERQQMRKTRQKEHAYRLTVSEKELSSFAKRFPFSFTKGQQNAIRDILGDIKKETPMARLLEGDVGSGKTAIAATAAYACIMSHPEGKAFARLQVAYMAPTEILATQLFENFISYFDGTGVSIGLITGSGCRKYPSKVGLSKWTPISRSQLSKWIENGEIPIVIGTHALIQKSVKLKHFALAIIDEQHRFGVNQRAKLINKDGSIPHLLSMTATPIPRTLALTMYGDLDLSVLDEMPKGRLPVITEIVAPHKRENMYKHLHKMLEDGRQCYIICPRIDEPDPTKEQALLAKSAVAEAKRLKKEEFPEYEIGVLHSKMSKDKKEEVMKEFSQGKTHILVATSVVEVGVNVPNATTIVIEGAERFGLAQLHQLRGRVQRSSHQPFCFLVTDTENQKSIDRLRAITKASNGFELAEMDLQLRGAGELSGGKQWGISDIGMEAIKNIKMVEAAREEARLLVTSNTLQKYPELYAEHKRREKNIHFE